jgi:hypothetical protein
MWNILQIAVHYKPKVYIIINIIRMSEFDSDPAPDHRYHLIQNEACKLTMTGREVLGVVQGCCVDCLVVSSIPLKKTLVFFSLIVTIEIMIMIEYCICN